MNKEISLMLYPTIDELTKGQYNRYELALATASCARLITEEYVRQHESVEKAANGKATKIIIPSNIQGIAGLASSIKEVMTDDTSEK